MLWIDNVLLVVETMDYFRAILAKNELSSRALALTADVIEQNSANYTAWCYRRACLFALNADLDAELLYVSQLARNSPKNYQLWHHRRALIEKKGNIGQELEHTVNMQQLRHNTDMLTDRPTRCW